MKDLFGIKDKKQNIRERIWIILEKQNVALFPGAWGRIPNFKDAEKCAGLLDRLPEWRKAEFIKSNPDSPQKYIREKALREGKTIYMAVPRLRETRCFIKLEPDKIKNIAYAATIKGAFKLGVKVYPSEIERIDLIVAGSVAVNLKGQRLGKGGGYSDLEYGIGRHFGFIKENTPIITSVHPLQIVKEDLPFLPHDIPVDYIVTPFRIYRAQAKFPRPEGILWEFLSPDKIAGIPILKELKSD